MRKSWFAFLTAASLAAVSPAVCLAGMYSEEDPVPSYEIEYSGPIYSPLEEESNAIQIAPAYDTGIAAEYIPGMPEIRALVDEVYDSEELVAFGETSPSEEAFSALEEEIEKLSEGNHHVSMIMADLTTQSGVSYRSTVPMCSQSTIKSIYIGALLESRPEALDENGQYMHDAIVFSDNDAYMTLRDIYGSGPILKWCEMTGVDEGFADMEYPRDHSARDMFKMWTQLYCFLNGGLDYADFGRYYADSSASATKKQLGNRFPVQTKAGWEHGLPEYQNFDPYEEIPSRFMDGDPMNNECTINDTGIVYTDNGPYIFVIYTDHPFGVFKDYTDVNPLYDLVEALYQVQDSLHAED